MVEIARVQLAAVDDNRPADHVALFGRVVRMRGVDGAGLGADEERGQFARPVEGQYLGLHAGQAGLHPVRIAARYGVAPGRARGGEDALAQRRRRLHQLDIGNHGRRGRVVEPGHLRPQLDREPGHASGQLGLLLGVERADGVGERQCFHFVGHQATHCRRPRMAIRPVRILVFTVPNGTPKREASSAWVQPSKKAA